MTERDKTIMDEMMVFIKAYIAKHGYSPTQQEIIADLNISVPVCNRCMKQLIKDKKIETDLDYLCARAYCLPRRKK